MLHMNLISFRSAPPSSQTVAMETGDTGCQEGGVKCIERRSGSIDNSSVVPLVEK